MIGNAATENLELIVMDGPYAHIGPGNVLYATKDGLKRDENYSLWVHLNSLAGSSASNRYYFGTFVLIIATMHIHNHTILLLKRLAGSKVYDNNIL